MDFLLPFGSCHYLELFRGERPYFSREGQGEIGAFAAAYQKNYELTNGKGLICIPSGNHDTARIGSSLDHEELKIAYAFLLSMPGAPFVYYGDEIGMRHLSLVSVEGGYDRTGARSPMQWDHSPNHGFSSAPAEALYTPQDMTVDAPTVSDQRSSKASLWHEVQRLIRIRREHPALCATGKIEFVYCGPNKFPLVYLRTQGDSRVLVVLNPSRNVATCPCPYELGEAIYIHGGKAVVSDGMLHMQGESAGFFALE